MPLTLGDRMQSLPPLPPTRPSRPSTPIDFALVLDESGSMKKPKPDGSMEGHGGLKALAKRLVSQYPLGEDAARFAVVSFAADATARVPWSHSATEIHAGIDQMSADGKTSISDGFEAARQLFANTRPGATKVVLFVSDGEQTVDAAPFKTPEQTAIDAAAQVKEDGATVFAWGFGDKVSLAATLEQIATDSSKAVLVQEVGELTNSLVLLEAAICNESPPSPPPPPMDFVLVLDESGSMKQPKPDGSMEGPHGMKAFAKTLVSQYALGEDAARFAVVSFAADATTRVTWSYDASAINAGIDQMSADGKTSISDGLEAAGQLFASSRPGATKIVLLVSDGEQTVDAAPGKTLLETAVDASAVVKGLGATVFTWGFGGKVSSMTVQQIATDSSKAIVARDLAELTNYLGWLKVAVYINHY